MKILKSKKGMSVVEIVVALGILGLVSAGFMGFFTDSFKFQARNQQISTMQKIADQTIERLKNSNGKNVTIGENTLDISGMTVGNEKTISDDNYEYRIKVNSISSVDNSKALYDVTINVFLKENTSVTASVNSTVQIIEAIIDEDGNGVPDKVEPAYIRYYSDNVLVKEDKLYSGTYVISSYIPSKEGNIFDSWIDDDDYVYNAGYQISYEELKLFDNGLSLYAKWRVVLPLEELYTLTYDKNGGDGEMSPQTVVKGESINLLANAFTKTGYTFVGWSTASSATSATYTDKQNITPNSDMILYAVWKENYTITYNANGGTGSMASQTVVKGNSIELRENTFTSNTHIFIGWSTNSNAVSATYVDKQNITPTASMTLYAIWGEKILSDVVKVGDYVTYVPSSTSYTVPTTVSGHDSNQTYNPSSTTSWRVFSKEGENIEIISTLSVGSLYLNGSTGYTNAVQTLNDMSRAFTNSAYTISGRSLGYYDDKIVNLSDGSLSDITEAQKANYKVINTASYPFKYHGGVGYEAISPGFPYVDNQESLDATVIREHNMMDINDDYIWLASRSISNLGSDHCVDFMYDTGNMSQCLYVVGSNSNTEAKEVSRGVRPIITLKSGLTVTGKGTEAEPYVINTTNPSQYIVTYCANGGYGEMNPQSVAQGRALELAENAYEHHTGEFKGWSTDATATTATYINEQTITPTKDMTLYAVWGNVSAPTLAANGSWYKGTTQKSVITQIDILSSYTPTGTVKESWNADVANTGTIKCYIEGTKLTIAGNGSETILANSDSSYMFGDIDYLALGFDYNGIDVTESGITKIEGNEFSNVTSINGLDIVDTKNATIMEGMFRGCEALTSVDVSKFNTSAVTDMSGMFYGCRALTSIDVSKFNTSNVTDMYCMFYNCQKLSKIDVGNFDTGKVTNMMSMFNDCLSLTKLDISGFNTTSVKYMPAMFNNCSSLTELNVSGFDTTNLTHMNDMFMNCSSLTSLDVSNFDTCNIDGSMRYVFYGCTKLAELDLSNFDTSGATSIESMFYNMKELQEITLSENFIFVGDKSAQLPEPSDSYITGANGKWYKANGTKLTAEEVIEEERNKVTTYYAINPVKNLLDVATVGAYVTYVPSSTKYTVPSTVSGYPSDQTFNPSSTTSWRVFSVDGENIEIISTESVEELGLRDHIGHENAVQTLNDMSRAFVNETYAAGGRSLGYYDEKVVNKDGTLGADMTETDLAHYKTADTSTYYLAYSYCETLLNDYQYIPDQAVLKEHGFINNSGKLVWLASRYDNTDLDSGFYGMRVMGADGTLSNGLLSGPIFTTAGRYVELGVRPIVSLKSNLTVSGSGTQADPYVINTTNSSQCTVTYCANGGYGEMNPQSTSEEDLTLTKNAYKHHTKEFKGWSTNPTAATAEYTDEDTINLTEDMTLYAVWGGWNISVAQAENGTITPGTTYVDARGTQSFTIAPDSGYVVNKIFVDGEDQGTKECTFETDYKYTIRSKYPYPWKKSGNDFISSNQGIDNTTSVSEISLTGTGTLSFDYSVSSENGYDYLDIFVASSNGTETVVQGMSGTSSGTYSKEISGDITITLSYRKNRSQASGDDCGRISNLKFVTECNLGSNVFTFTNVKSNHTLTAEFVKGVLLSSRAEVGDYITYVPSSTSYTVPTTVSGYTSNQNFNPSGTRSWRVLSNDGENIEIISTESVGTLYLGGETGYINAVQTLNDMSRAFVNSTYAESGRSLGYYDETRYTSETNSGSAMTEAELANYKVIDTSIYPVSENINGGFPYADYQYIAEGTTNLNKVIGNGAVWLASRFEEGLSDSSFYVRYKNGTSSAVVAELLKRFYYYVDNYDEGYWETSVSRHSYGVRPIVTLKADLKVTTGSGTESDPYIINLTNPSQYTITYNANGGYGEMNPQSVAQGSSLPLATNAYKHHTKVFKGWATSATATTATYTDGQTITPTSDMTLYAVWQEITCMCTYCDEILSQVGYCSNCIECSNNIRCNLCDMYLIPCRGDNYEKRVSGNYYCSNCAGSFMTCTICKKDYIATSNECPNCMQGTGGSSSYVMCDKCEQYYDTELWGSNCPNCVEDTGGSSSYVMCDKCEQYYDTELWGSNCPNCVEDTGGNDSGYKTCPDCGGSFSNELYDDHNCNYCPCGVKYSHCPNCGTNFCPNCSPDAVGGFCSEMCQATYGD